MPALRLPGGAAACAHQRARRPGGPRVTTLRHYTDPVPEVDRHAAAYLAQLTAGSATQSG
jgi:hypothetical protein